MVAEVIINLDILFHETLSSWHHAEQEKAHQPYEKDMEYTRNCCLEDLLKCHSFLVEQCM